MVPLVFLHLRCMYVMYCTVSLLLCLSQSFVSSSRKVPFSIFSAILRHVEFVSQAGCPGRRVSGQSKGSGRSVLWRESSEIAVGEHVRGGGRSG